MKALSSLKSAINQSSLLSLAALIAIVPLAYPEIGLAAGLQTQGINSAVVFEIKDSSSLQNQNLTIQQVASVDPLNGR